jgi:hypothetical protein
VLRRHLAQTLVRAGTPVFFHPGGRTEILDPIFGVFARGIGCGVEGVSGADLRTFQDQVEWNRRVFFREGYAFGIGAVEALRRGTTNPEARNRGGSDYRMMHYTGYGFWNGFARTLGLRGLPETAAAWADVADYPRLHPFLVGGRSFAAIARTKTITPALLAGFEREATPSLTEAAWHGCGRGIWFRGAAQPDVLTGFLTLYPPATAAMTLGLGVAMCFTQIATPDVVMRTIESMPPRFHDDLALGAGVALAAHVHDEPREEARIRSLFTGTLGARRDAVLAAVQGFQDDTTWYSTLRARLEPASQARAAS